MVYGPAQNDARKLVPFVIEALLRGESPELSSGRRLVDWIFVEDVVDGLLALAESDATGAVDLGSGDIVSVRRVAELLGELVDPSVRLRFGAVEDRVLESVVTADVDRTRSLIAWSAQTPLQTGLERTVDWHRSRACGATVGSTSLSGGSPLIEVHR
jgi:nucleoside-diphosphate-sugar epimerase